MVPKYALNVLVEVETLEQLQREAVRRGLVHRRGPGAAKGQPAIGRLIDELAREVAQQPKQ